MTGSKLQLTIRLDIKVLAKIKKIAEVEYRSANNMIEYALVKEIAAFEEKNGEIMLTDEDVSQA